MRPEDFSAKKIKEVRRVNCEVLSLQKKEVITALLFFFVCFGAPKCFFVFFCHLISSHDTLSSFGCLRCLSSTFCGTIGGMCFWRHLRPNWKVGQKYEYLSDDFRFFFKKKLENCRSIVQVSIHVILLRTKKSFVPLLTKPGTTTIFLHKRV